MNFYFNEKELFNMNCMLVRYYLSNYWLHMFIIHRFSCILMRLTGEGDLSQWYVTVQTVIDETDADALRLHLHPRQSRRVAARAGVSSDSGVACHVLSVLQQPRGRLVQLA